MSCMKKDCHYKKLFYACIDNLNYHRCDTRADPIDFSPASYSKASYRGYFGRGNRKVIPSRDVFGMCCF